jgi:predicted RNase H-like HicB family nuclease
MGYDRSYIATESKYQVNTMLSEYIRVVLKSAVFEPLDEGELFCSVPQFRGAWSKATTHQECLEKLASVLEEFILMDLQDGIAIPEVDGMKLNFPTISVREEAA